MIEFHSSPTTNPLISADVMHVTVIGDPDGIEGMSIYGARYLSPSGVLKR